MIGRRNTIGTAARTTNKLLQDPPTPSSLSPPPQLVVGLKSFVPESEASERLSQGITGEGDYREGSTSKKLSQPRKK